MADRLQAYEQFVRCSSFGKLTDTAIGPKIIWDLNALLKYAMIDILPSNLNMFTACHTSYAG